MIGLCMESLWLEARRKVQGKILMISINLEPSNAVDWQARDSNKKKKHLTKTIPVEVQWSTEAARSCISQFHKFLCAADEEKKIFFREQVEQHKKKKSENRIKVVDFRTLVSVLRIA